MATEATGMPVTPNTQQLKLTCLHMAQNLNPKDAGDLIKKAAGIFNWITRDETPNE